MRIIALSSIGLGLVLCATACSSAQSGTDPGKSATPGAKVSLSLGAAAQADKDALDAKLAKVKKLDAAGFAEQTAVSFEELGYSGKDALGIDLIQGSSLPLGDDELAKLDENGFVVQRREFPTFAYGYATIYADDLPLFVSADSILYALHRSYDGTLKALERQSLAPSLKVLLEGMKTRLGASDIDAEMKKDVDVFLSVGQSLLAGQVTAPLDGSLADQVKSLFDKCTAAEGSETVTLFGAKRLVDFSQCKPRGHYTDAPALEKYFRAMMWFGRTDFRLIETNTDGTQTFMRRQLQGAFVLRELLSQELFDREKAIDDAITAFVGEHDSMTLPEVDALKKDLGIDSVSQLADFSDQELAQAILNGGYGTQRISSQYMVNGVGGTLPLASSFTFFGQRYVVDSHVFSNVVYDRAGGGNVKRMMPDPLDVAYAALGNDQAGMLLAPQLEMYAYAPDLASMRVLVDSEKDGFWSQNLYNSWLGALRELSPSSARVDSADAPLPSVARTEAWGRRLLNTQLASWAELRHDTILYAKQSYTTGASCEFPDAYVEPYPAFFERVKEYADKAAGVLLSLPFAAPTGAVEHYQQFATVAGTLQEMAEHQRTGTPQTDEAMAFINQAVTIQSEGCGTPVAQGWYPNLFYGADPTEFSPTIADVHTQPTDEAGVEVGRVLHVGTGHARAMVVTFDTCSGPRAYVGLASSYYELVTEDFERLTDEDWATRVENDAPPAPTWVEPILAK